MPTRSIRPLPVAMLIASTTLAGCARHAEMATATATAPVAAPPRPTLPIGYGAVKPPPRDAAGAYRTINSGLDAQATIWHVRAALNVAAIGCRGPDASGIVPAYNAMLASKKAVLARAQRSVQAALQADAGKDWQAADDSAMTRRYNYFAMPTAKPAFCDAAAALALEAAATPPAQFEAFAATALPRLETPFTEVYRTVDDHAAELAQWEARYGADATAIAVAQPAPSPTAVSADAKPPTLAYADLAEVIAWSPRKGDAYAAR